MAYCIIRNLTLVFMSLVSAAHLGASQNVTITQICEFTEWALDANCRNRDLEEIPLEYKTAVSMDIRNNRLKILTAGNFTGFRDLRYLDLEFNTISEINSGAFGGCDSLLYIYLQFNLLESVEEGAFEGSSSLERLFLNQNSISQLHQDAFRGLGALTGLYIGLNEISQLPAGLFRHTPLLKYLHMGDNLLTNLSPQIFAGLSDLTYLNIMNNNLNIIESGTFDPLQNLEELDLSGNLLISINAFPTLPNLKILDLYNNEMREISSLSEMVEGLDELYLGQNNLSCTCSMNSIREWIQRHKSDEGVDASKVDLTCHSPQHLEGKLLDSILREELCRGDVALGHIPASTPTKSEAATRRTNKGPFQTLMPRTSATSGRHNVDSRHNNDDQGINEERYLFLGLDDAIVYVLAAGVTVSVIVLAMCVIIRCLAWRTERYHQQLDAATMKRQKNHVTEDPYSFIPSQPPPRDPAFVLHEGFSNNDNAIPGSWNAYPDHINSFESSKPLFGFRPLPPSGPIPKLEREQLHRAPSYKHTQDGYQAVTIPEGYSSNLDMMYPAPALPGYDYQDLGIEADLSPSPQHSPSPIKHEYFTQFWIPTQGQQV
ncbi:uncharacterized protein [Asterias amurensis]|uniref:uncharacterized protein n=1 Tax=Asterias amurensis TaxID=7602 RepID=UPI003AB5B536